MTDVTFKRCDSCERCNSLDVEPSKRCGPVVRYMVQLSDWRSPFFLDICEACAAQRPIKTLHTMAREALARMTGNPRPEHEPE